MDSNSEKQIRAINAALTLVDRLQKVKTVQKVYGSRKDSIVIALSVEVEHIENEIRDTLERGMS